MEFLDLVKDVVMFDELFVLFIGVGSLMFFYFVNVLLIMLGL